MSAEPSKAVKFCGTELTDAPSRLLKAGPLSVELENGALRYVKWNGVEVIRQIAFLVRDQNWGTYTPTITDLDVKEDAAGFSVRYHGACADARQKLTYDASITGKASGALAFEVNAVADTEVTTNRTGFIVLHPAGLAGKPVRVLHVDGKEVDDRFPELINPLQPFYQIRALTHEVQPGVKATCRMEGDAFEMEDQRNWTDASYKTYVRPLALPWPYALEKGSKHAQSVRLDIAGAAQGNAAGAGSQAIAVTLGKPAGKMPLIGIGVPGEEAQHAVAAGDLMKQLSPKVLVCHIDLRKGHGAKEMTAYRQLGEKTGAEVVVEAVIPAKSAASLDDEIKTLATALKESGLKPASVAVSPAQDLASVLPGSKGADVPPADQIYAAARKGLPGIRLGGGMFSYFTELNRKRPPQGALDFVTHTTCPIVHAPDDRSVMETLETLPAVIASTKAFIHGAPYRVGPSAIGCRDNPYGKTTLDNPDNSRVCLSWLDPRQRGLFGAVWALGYVAAFARAGGVEVVSLGAPTGPFGFIYRKADYAQPYFDGLKGPAVYPAFHVMAGLGQASGAERIDVTVSDPSQVEALAYQAGGKPVLWLANLTSHPVKVALKDAGDKRIAILDAVSFGKATTDANALDALRKPVAGGEIALDAYAVARLD